MLRILKWIGITIAAFLVLIAIFLWVNHEPMPKGESGPKAEALAQKMLTAINKPAWDSIRFVQWTFKDMHHFLWDKENHLAEVKWNDSKVLLDINKVDGRAWEEGVEQTGSSKDWMITKAWAIFINDAFWLNAPAKVYDSGTSRQYVALQDGKEGLLVSYSSGGMTPGDSYLWILDENGLPESWKMWVKIIPVGGVEFTWENWLTLEGGAKVAQFHSNSWLDTSISNLKAGDDLKDFGLQESLFQPIANVIQE